MVSDYSLLLGGRWTSGPCSVLGSCLSSEGTLCWGIRVCTTGKDRSPQFGHAQCPGESLGERKCKNECVNSCMDCVFAFLPGAVLKRVQVFTYFSQIPVGQVRKLRHRKSQVIWPSSYSNNKLYSGAMLLRREGVLRLWSQLALFRNAFVCDVWCVALSFCWESLWEVVTWSLSLCMLWG